MSKKIYYHMENKKSGVLYMKKYKEPEVKTFPKFFKVFSTLKDCI